jgi:class 3 adenylate cyclase
MEPRIQYAKTSDGVSIAYTAWGEGPALIVPPTIYFQCSLLSKVPELEEFYGKLGSRRIILYDSRGFGLSQRDATPGALDDYVRDLEAVVQAEKLTKHALFASTLSGPQALAYTARHQDVVTHLVLWGTYSRANDVMPDQQIKPLIELCRTNWPIASQVFADMSTRQEYANVGIILAKEWRENADGASVADAMQRGLASDVDDLLPGIETPALVMHRFSDEVIPFACGQKLAAQLPNARLLRLEGSVHAFMLGDQPRITEAINAFLGDDGQAASKAPPGQSATVTILFTDLTSSTSLTQRLGDAKAQELVRAHNTIVREALAAQGGSEIKHTGDGIMASFPIASGALECAIAIQRAVDARGDANLSVHIGVNAGEPVAEDADLFGTSVQLARRICDHARSGEVLASNVVRELSAGKGFLFADIGEVVPKGFEEPVRLYEVRWRE